MLAIITSLFLLSISGFIVTGFLAAKKQNSLFATVVLILSAVIFSTAIILEKRYSYRIEMQRRLNEPIISLDQFYGYKILDKRYITEKASDEKPTITTCFVDLEDVLPKSKGVLKNIRVTEKIYNNPAVETGKVFLPNEPNAPKNKDPG